jgi:hypothetical protein
MTLGLVLASCEGETDGPLAGDQFTPYNRLVRDYKQLVTITFAGESVKVGGAAADQVQVTRDSATPARLTISSSARGIAYFVSGKSDDCQLRIESTQPYALYLNGVTLSSSQGPVIESTGAENAYVVLCTKSTNTLSDSGVSDTTSACLSFGGCLIFNGTGALGVTAPGGDGIYAAGGAVELGSGAYTINAARYGLSSGVGNVTLEGGTLYGTAATGAFVHTPAGRGLAIASGTCLAASAEASEVLLALDDDEIFPAQTSWQQRVDSLAFSPDTTRTLSATVEAASAASCSVRPVAQLANPYILLSVASLTSWSEVKVTVK